MKRYSIIALLFVAVLGAAAIADAAERRGRDDRSRRDEGRWELLGRQEVDFRSDHDRINVGKREGVFNRLEIRVEGAPVEIDQMVVTFNNGEKFEPKIKHRFSEGSRSQSIDLPAERRAIKQIDFNYRSVDKREGKATVSVYGR